MPNWKQVLGEINRVHQKGYQDASGAVDSVRRKYLKQLHKFTGRNVIAYYSGFLNKPNIMGLEINDEDKNGFMMAIHGLDRTRGLDLFLHTPGGDIAATESLIRYLRYMFGKDIRAIIHQIAMSAGTILACACNTIIMGKHSNLGPVDPHLKGLPAQGVLDEFLLAYEEMKKDSSKINVWRFIIGQYPPTFLGACENAINWSKDLVRNQLEEVMFSDEPDQQKRRDIANEIVEKLMDYKSHKDHRRHIHLNECQEMGLKIELLEQNPHLQDLVLTVHHCFIHTLSNTPAFKIIENHTGAAFIKQHTTMPEKPIK